MVEPVHTTGNTNLLRFTNFVPTERAACEFVQDVAVAVIAALTPSGEPSRGRPPSRRQFATSVGVGLDTLIDILKGRRWPRTDRLIRIAHRAGVTIGTL